ncbi:MAG: EAL domain-containing protein [Gammaproteobacteria bacterium]|nr:EAL domain-containing protein [Gammaproteobacteria bacterium]
MNIANQLSIKNKTYLLILLSVVVALILSIVSNNGFNSIHTEVDEMVYATKIERYTNKLILEEQNYRLNANGSVYDFSAANQAYENAIKYVDEIYQILNQIDKLGLDDSDILIVNQQQTRRATDEYKSLYLKGVSLLTELNKQANILGTEGEYITLQIQQYVESKRVEIKNNLSEKTVEKINNGSNIWQYTYVTRLSEKEYRLSPDDEVFESFKKDYQFMMSEWLRLKGMSDQTFEFDKLDKFKTSAENYESAMLLWVDLNKQLVAEVLPEMKRLGSGVISNAIQSAERSVQHMSEKRKVIAATLFVVSLLTIVLGVMFGAAIARSISSVVSSFQDGLLNFFRYLNQEQNSAQPIVIHGNDEISVMAKMVNENIIKIQGVLDRKVDYQKALLEWSMVDYQDDYVTIHSATELSAKALHVERVSIWLFNDDKTVLTCADLYLSNTGKHESGAVLVVEDYPEYFKAIYSGEILVVNNAREDARTREFVDSYLKPLNICSMLDAPIVQDEHLIGVICHEKVAETKCWEPDEEEFAGSMVNAISLSLEIKKRRFIQEELKLQKETLHYHAHHDPLTDLPNRFLFDDRLNQSIKQARRDLTQLAVLFIDLDHFKGINDSMGHKVGDELLVEVAKRLKSGIRQTDTLARLGGDEFSIVLNQVANNDVVVEVTQSLIRAMNEPIELRDQSFYITLSVGVAIYPEDGHTPEELLKNADAAMYQAKDEGRNTYQFYTQIMTEKAFERIAMETSFRNALSKEEFVVYYQPQVNAETDQIVGMEALVRWMHPDMGLIAPAKFLSFASDTGLIIQLDQWVMKTAMMQCVHWYQDGLQPGVLALNVSMRQLQKEDFVDALQQLLEETGCQPQWLELEVTEGLIMKDTSIAIQLLNRIKDLGVGLAIDDFGTGYSSLSQLKRLPINKLKIDRSFIHGLPNDEEDVVISKTIIALSKNMGLSVLAEGVETSKQKDFLLQNGCNYMQGFYCGVPMLSSDIEKELKLQVKA